MKEGQPKDGFLTRTGRRALAGVKGVEHFGREIADGLQVIEEGLTSAVLTVTVLPWMDRGLLALRSRWERQEYEYLQSKGGAKTAARAEGRLEKARGAVADATEKIPLALDTARRHVHDEILRINEIVASIPSFESHALSTKDPLDFESVDMQLDSLEALTHRTLAAKAKERGGAIEDEEFKSDAGLAALRDLIDASESLRKTMAHESTRVTKEQRTLERARKTAEKAEVHGDLPRTRVLERERLMAQREKFSDLVHRVRLKKIEGRRKLEELDADIKQLQRGLNPNKERDQREYMGMRMAREELLNRLLPQAELFESETQLNAKIKSSKNIGQLGRRPRLYDVETLLLGLSMPPDVRIHLSAVLYQPYRTVEKYRYQNVPADTRHSFIKPAQVARVIRALEEELVRYGAVATEEVPA
jgi:hypothetical protein